METRVIASVLCLAVAAGAAAGCGGGDAPADGNRTPSAETGSSSPDSGGEAAAAPGTKLTLAESQFGRVLVDSDRQAIYLFDRETGSKPACYGACADAWPPVYASGRPRVAANLEHALLGTARRRDDRRQLTYAGHPLYYYAHEGPGQVLCHDVAEFGGLWLALTRTGEPAPTTGGTT
jgi:predicted lipoprotein with Yx(FWY)xxD motif